MFFARVVAASFIFRREQVDHCRVTNSKPWRGTNAGDLTRDLRPVGMGFAGLDAWAIGVADRTPVATVRCKILMSLAASVITSALIPG